jgi:2'-5' RNA ligase
VRAFFALWPDESERRALHAQAVDMAARAKGRAIAADKLHLTLVFLGEIDDRTVACLSDGAGHLDAMPIELEMGRLGGWPGPGIAWIAPVAVPESLARLQFGLAALARECGVLTESRRYFPHMTLARGAKARVNEARCEPIALRLRGFCLVRSDLGSGRYEVIGRWA